MDTLLVDLWPLFGLELRTPRLVLTPIRDEHLPGLVAAVRAGVHDPAEHPFDVPWTSAPADEIGLNTVRHLWASRAANRPEHWDLQFAVLRDGVPIGVQDVRADHFGVVRTVSTGSWLQRAHQGQGLGSEMRAAILAFAFDHLGALRAGSAAFVDNPASLRVSAKLGYVDNGGWFQSRRPGESAESRRLLVTPDTFVRPEWAVEVSGLEPCRTLLGF